MLLVFRGSPGGGELHGLHKPQFPWCLNGQNRILWETAAFSHQVRARF